MDAQADLSLRLAHFVGFVMSQTQLAARKKYRRRVMGVIGLRPVNKFLVESAVFGRYFPVSMFERECISEPSRVPILNTNIVGQANNIPIMSIHGGILV